MQKIVFSSPFVRQPCWEKVFYLNTDASKAAISFVLLQEFDRQLLPISYFLHALLQSESNYHALKLELMAVVKGVEAFKHYLYSRQFILLSDIKPLQHYKKISSPASLTTRWLIKLSEYSYTFSYVKGTNNVLPDFLSRVVPDVIVESLKNMSLLNSQEILPVVTNLSEQNVNVINCEAKDNVYSNNPHGDVNRLGVNNNINIPQGCFSNVYTNYVLEGNSISHPSGVSESPSLSYGALQDGESYVKYVNNTLSNPSRTVNSDEMHIDQSDPHNEVSNATFARHQKTHLTCKKIIVDITNNVKQHPDFFIDQKSDMLCRQGMLG